MNLSRKEQLRQLVRLIESGEYGHSAYDPHNIYERHNSARQEYQHPKEVSKLYPGKETWVWEMDAGSGEAF